jgi:hypothetical protein
VDGDLIEFSPELLAQLRGEAEAIDKEFDRNTMVPNKLKGTPAEGRIARNHGHRQLAQESLRNCIALWAGVRRDRGADDHEIYRRFYHTFNVDIATAQTLGTEDAAALQSTIEEGYWK